MILSKLPNLNTMDALENSQRKKKDELQVIDQFNNEKIGIDRLITHLEKWEKDYPSKSLKQDVDEFKFALEARRLTVINQLKKL